MTRTIVFDLETTGVDIRKDLPIQLAYGIWGDDGSCLLTNLTYINILPYAEIQFEAFKVHGISSELLRHRGATPDKVSNLWHRIVWDSFPCRLIGYNIINFDFPMWQNFLHRFKTGRFKFPPLIEITDVMHLASHHFSTKKWLKLRDCARRLGLTVDEEKLHDAEYDVKLCWGVYNILEGFKQ